MKFLADLHIHSKFSIATAKNLDLAHLHQAAQLKGLTLVGTGDCTHPGWLAEIRSHLVPAEPGLFKLNADAATAVDATVPTACRRPVRFMLQGEISCIYKKEGRTRKNHNLVYLPDLESAQTFSRNLEKIGNIGSDGRPILGLDARNLLEILLETTSEAFLIPAHIWTPWFSMLGSKSGFDSLEACFDDLSSHIFAVETGLSSDPAMNWRVPALDGLTLVSNSDAHSPLKLGREANCLDAQLSFAAVKEALQRGAPPGFRGTVEFYPEEGKYHLDGHRKCGVRWEPRRTLEAGGICPVCEKPLTLGVLHRVEALADRGPKYRPEGHPPYERIIPLKDILSEIFRVGPQSKKVQGYIQQALERLGSEMDILLRFSPEQIDGAGIDLLGEAVDRMRQGRVSIAPGYDGEFGVVRIFTARERRELSGQRGLFGSPKMSEGSGRDSRPPPVQRELNFKISGSPVRTTLPLGGAERAAQGTAKPPPLKPVFKLNAAQQAAVDHEQGPLLIVAGPGTGKTRTLTQRMARLLKERLIPASQMLAVTFTNKAAEEMQTRVGRLVGDSSPLPWIGTFHALGRRFLQDPDFNLGHGAYAHWTLADEPLQQQLVAEARRQVRHETKLDLPSVAQALSGIMSAKQALSDPDHCPLLFSPGERQQGFIALYRRYEALLAWQNVLDFEDLMGKVILTLDSDPDVVGQLHRRLGYLFIDEYQDINTNQYRLVRKLAPATADICAIGDPDQSIYGFRGSDKVYFERFTQDYPGARVIRLARNYRSTPAILKAALEVLPPIEDETETGHGEAISSARELRSDIPGPATVGILESPTPRTEAVAVGKTIEALMEGMDLHAIDQRRIDPNGAIQNSRSELGFSDFAVLFRTLEQRRVFGEVFDKAGIPWRLAGRREILDQPALVCLLALFKLMENRGNLWDLIHSATLLRPRLSNSTLDILKTWSFERGFSFAETLHNVRRFPIATLGSRRQRQLNLWIETLEKLKTELRPYALTRKLAHLAQHLGLSQELETNDAAREGFAYLTQWAADAADNTDRFFSRLVLNQDQDLLGLPAEKVSLLTMHTAKGLEFNVVFVVGCEDGWIPLGRETGVEGDEDEERRLLYVAMTRARQRLYLSWSRSRTLYGRRRQRKFSPLLARVDPRILLREALAEQRPRKPRQLQLF